MKIPIKFAEIKTPLFLGNKNHKTKLDPGRIAGLSMEYDRAEKELLVTWNAETAIIPSGDIASMVEGIPTMKAVQHTHPIVAGIASAQVETPMSHVHAGHGHGKSGLGGKVK